VLVDMPQEHMEHYTGAYQEPSDLDAFWRDTLADEPGATGVQAELVQTSVRTIDIFDVVFRGHGGDPVRAWLRIPAGVRDRLPVIVEYVGYGLGRGLPTENLFFASSGFAHLHMDTRGQGAQGGVGHTADSGRHDPQYPGFMTRGIRSRESYYYKRLYVDAVRAVSAAKQLPNIDPDRVGVHGKSQGGGIALAVAGLRPDISALAAFVPFLCDFPRAIRITDSHPYREIGEYLSVHRKDVDLVHRTLSYFDGVGLARRATAPALFTTALMDPVTPPSTVFAAYNNYGGPKALEVWPFNGHEGGGHLDENLAVEHFTHVLSG